MKSKKVIIICIIVLLLFGLYFRNIIGAVLIRSEHIDQSAFASMLSARLNPEKVVVLNLDNKNYSIPLPKGSSKFENQQYKRFPTSEQFLSSTTDSGLDRYVKETLPKYGWVNSERFGAAIVVANQDGKAVICITQNAFTHFYSRLSYSISSIN